MHLQSPRFEIHSCRNTTLANQSLLDHTPRYTSQYPISSPQTQARLAPNPSTYQIPQKQYTIYLSTLQTQGPAYRSACMLHAYRSRFPRPSAQPPKTVACTRVVRTE